MNLTAKHLAAGVSELAAFRALAALTSVLALLFAFLRRWHRLLLLLMAVPGGRVACFLLKAVFQRQRPYFEGLVLPAHGYSFPSDHAMGATLAYGFVAVLALEIYRSWPARLVLGTIAAFLIVLVGLSRVALNAHYPSDVLGAIAAGLAWLIVSFTIFHVNSSLR